VGHDVVEKPPFFMQPGGSEVVHVSYSPAEVDPVYFPRLQVIGDVANAIWQLREQLHRQSHWETAGFLEVKRSLEAHIAARVESSSFPIKPQRLVRDVRAALPEDGILTLDNGMFKIWFARNYPAYRPNTVLLDNALATMGAGLPSAIAAALLHPKRKVVALCGDGGFLMTSQELETARRLRVNLTVVILRDDGYGMIRWKQQNMGLTDFGLSFENPDFVAYANAYGASGQRITRTGDFLPTLKKALDTPGVHVIDLPIDYSENRSLTLESERKEA
jgi:acetolactate synthase-1/2/3 large subunit